MNYNNGKDLMPSDIDYSDEKGLVITTMVIAKKQYYGTEKTAGEARRNLINLIIEHLEKIK